MGGAIALVDGPKIPVGEFARKVSHFVAEAAANEPITLTRNGEPLAVVIGFERYQELAELEETAEDLYWSVVALHEYLDWIKAGRETVPLSEVVTRAGERDGS